MLKKLSIAVAVIVAGVLLFAATRPDTFSVRRSATIAAPPQAVYPLIADFKRWEAWSPWEKKDPAMKRAYGARTEGAGASYAWEGNSDVGKGSMRIAEAQPPSKVVIQLDFEQPFEAHNRVDFALAPSGPGTDVTWTMQGPVPYFAKIIHLFVDMDAMVGKDFETGLANLKRAAEEPAGAGTRMEGKQ
jgi:uncharacterized protein YndB with AHSA1/START domain